MRESHPRSQPRSLAGWTRRCVRPVPAYRPGIRSPHRTEGEGNCQRSNPTGAGPAGYDTDSPNAARCGPTAAHDARPVPAPTPTRPPGKRKAATSKAAATSRPRPTTSPSTGRHPSAGSARLVAGRPRQVSAKKGAIPWPRNKRERRDGSSAGSKSSSSATSEQAASRNASVPHGAQSTTTVQAAAETVPASAAVSDRPRPGATASPPAGTVRGVSSRRPLRRGPAPRGRSGGGRRRPAGRR
jgi:hypothetical protein